MFCSTFFGKPVRVECHPSDFSRKANNHDLYKNRQMFMIPLHLSSLVAPAIGKSNQLPESHQTILRSKALDPKDKVES